MRAFFVFVILCVLDFSSSFKSTYTSAIVNYSNDGFQGHFNRISTSLKQMDLDLVMLMRKQTTAKNKDEHCFTNQFDEVIDSVSKLAKEINSYVLVDSAERALCYNTLEIFNTKIMFDRRGIIVSMLKTPVNKFIECNSTVTSQTSILTDFDVKFDLITAEDVVAREPKELMKNKNYILVDSLIEQLPFLTANQLLGSLSQNIGINILSQVGVYGTSTVKRIENDIVIADITKEPSQEKSQQSIIYQKTPKYLTHEDLTDYVKRPVDLTASVEGLQETVCHNRLCCEFYVKTEASDFKQTDGSNYSFVVFDGVRPTGAQRNIGVQNCALIACKGLYKRNCYIESSFNSTIQFKNIKIAGNFSSKDTMQFPTTLSAAILPMTPDSYQFDSSTHSNHKHVSIESGLTQDLFVFGIFGRDYSKDFTVEYVDKSFSLYEYILNEDVVEFFDYAWIKIRFLLVIVTIYVLEQM